MPPAPAAGEGRFGAHRVALKKPLWHAHGRNAQRAITKKRPQHPPHPLPGFLELPDVPELVHHQPIEPVYGAQPQALLRRGEKLGVARQKRHEAIRHRGLALQHHRNGPGAHAQRSHVGAVQPLQARSGALRG